MVSNFGGDPMAGFWDSKSFFVFVFARGGFGGSDFEQNDISIISGVFWKFATFEYFIIIFSEYHSSDPLGLT